MLVPDGDRRHGSESGSVVNEKYTAIRHDHIMRKLVLRDYFGDELRMHVIIWFRCNPSKNLAKSMVRFDLIRKCRELRIG
jgi:hypothetical protein